MINEKYMQMSRADQIAYERHLLALADQEYTFGAARLEDLAEGREEGRKEGLVADRAEGRAEGLEEGRAEVEADIARNLKQMGFPITEIEKATGLTAEEISRL